MRLLKIIAPLAALTATTAITTGALAGCSGASPSPSSPSAPSQAPSTTSSTHGSWPDRESEAHALLTQCGLTHGTVRPPKGQPWYRHGKVPPLSGNRTADQHELEFDSWWTEYNSTVAGGRELHSWAEWSADHDRLPPAVCGSGVSASRLAARIFPGRPNPWG